MIASERADMTPAQRKASAIIIISILTGIGIAGMLNIWLVKDAHGPMLDRWTATDMRHWVEAAEKETGLNLPTPEHKP